MKDRAIVLDIDLDFFSLSQHDHRDLSIEITACEYEKIKNDPHHFTRNDGRNFLKQEKGRYFLCMNKKEGMHIRSSTQVSMDTVKTRIGKLKEFCRITDIEPALIHICRSRLSGYTPAHQWKDIEDSLLEMLMKEFEYTGPEYI